MQHNRELILNNYKVNLDKNIAFPVTFSISDFLQPEKQTRTVSKKIKLPSTQRNLKFFSDAFSLTLSEPQEGVLPPIFFDPLNKVTAEYKVASLTLLNGHAKLESIDIEEGNYSFNIVIVAEIIDIFAKLKGKSIKELNWSKYNHDLTFDNIINSWSESVILDGEEVPNFSGTTTTEFPNGMPLGFGYTYPVAELGFDRNIDGTGNISAYIGTNIFRAGRNIQPFFYVREIFYWIFENWFGIQVESDFFDTDDFKRMVIGQPPEEILTVGSGEIENRRVTLSTNLEVAGTIPLAPASEMIVNIGNPYIFNSQNIWYYFYALPSSTSYFGGYNQSALVDSETVETNVINDDYSQLEGNKITILKTGHYNFNLTGSFSAKVQFDQSSTSVYFAENQNQFPQNPWTSAAKGKRYFTIKVLKGGEVIDSLSVDLLIPITDINDDTYTTEEFNVSFPMFLNIGEEIEMKYELKFGLKMNAPAVEGEPAPEPPEVTYEVFTEDLVFDMQAIDTALTDGEAFEIIRYVPDIPADEFVYGIMKAYNMLVDEPTFDNKLKFTPYNDYYKPAVDAIDWTSKVDWSKKFEILPSAGIEGKDYLFDFAKSDDFDNKQYTEVVSRERYAGKKYTVVSPYAKGEKKFQLPFGAYVMVNIDSDSPETSYLGSNMVAPRVIQGNPIEGSVKPYKCAPLVCYYNGLNPTSEGGSKFRLWKNDFATSGDDELTFDYYPAINHQNHLTDPTADFVWKHPANYWEGWSGNLTNNNLWAYHYQMINSLTSLSSAIVKCYIALDEADIALLDFSRMIRINNVLYKLNKIIDFDSQSYSSTKVELVKMVESPAYNSGV